MGDLICVDPARVTDVWPMVEAMIDDAYAELDELTPNVRDWLLNKHGLLWVFAESNKVVACCTTTLEPRRGGLALRLVAAGAQDNAAGRRLWESCFDQIEKYAKAEGCYKIVFDGRPGWMKFLPSCTAKCISFEKRI